MAVVLSPSKRTEEVRVSRWAAVSFKFCYFTIMTVVYVPPLCDEYWWPEVLGGQHGADCHSLGAFTSKHLPVWTKYS